MNSKLITKIAQKSGLMDFCDCLQKPTENEMIFDTRIWTFDGYDPFDTLVWNKKGYNSFYNKADKLHIENDMFEAHLMYDISGYEYWSLYMEESNYLYLTIEFKKELDEHELESVFDLIMDKIIYPIQTKWEYLIDTQYYLRKGIKPCMNSK